MTETPADPRLARIIAEARAIRGDIDDIIRAAEANDIDELSRVAAFLTYRTKSINILRTLIDGREAQL